MPKTNAVLSNTNHVKTTLKKAKLNEAKLNKTNTSEVTRFACKYPLGKKIAKLRSDRGYEQKQLCIMLSDYVDNDNIKVPTLSSWEQCTRYPKIDMLIAMADFFNVSLDYFFDREKNYKDQPQIIDKDENSHKTRHGATPLRAFEMPEYNQKPVYVSFKENSHLDQWGILNIKKGIVRCADFDVTISNYIDIYPSAPDKPKRKRISNLQQLSKCENVYIEMISNDPAVNGALSGYYRHDNSKSFLINLTNAETLPYYGLNVTYYAYVG